MFFRHILTQFTECCRNLMEKQYLAIKVEQLHITKQSHMCTRLHLLEILQITGPMTNMSFPSADHHQYTSCFFFLLGTAKGHFPSLVSSLESQRGFPQSLSYRRYAAPQLCRNSLRLSEEKTDTPPPQSCLFIFPSLLFFCVTL